MILYSFSLHRIIRLAVAYGHCLRFLSNDENLRDEIHAHFKFETCALPIIHLLRERWLMRRQRRSISITSPFCTVQYSTLINQSMRCPKTITICNWQAAARAFVLFRLGPLRGIRAFSGSALFGSLRFGSVRFGCARHWHSRSHTSAVFRGGS